MGGTATEAAAVGDGVCVAEVSAELLAGCGAVFTIVLLPLYCRGVKIWLARIALRLIDQAWSIGSGMMVNLSRWITL